MSRYGDDHDGHVCERCDQEYLLRDDAEPTRWCDECAQEIAEDLTARLAAAEALLKEAVECWLDEGWSELGEDFPEVTIPKRWFIEAAKGGRDE